MKYMPLIFMFIGTAYAAGLSCPAGYMQFETDAIIISESGTCPSGTTYIGPVNSCDDDIGYCYMFGCPDGTLLYDGACVAVCASGFGALQTASGFTFTAWATRNTTPSIIIQNGNRAPCYVNLAPTNSAVPDAINIEYQGRNYYTVK